MSVLIKPAKKRLLRKIGEMFVKRLKAEMPENPSSDSAPIVALVCLKDFEPSKSHTYNYETIGGNTASSSRNKCRKQPPSTRLVSYKGRLVDLQQSTIMPLPNIMT